VTKRSLLPIIFIVVLVSAVIVGLPVVLAQDTATGPVDPIPQVSAEPVTVRYNEGITVEWNTPILGFNYELPTGMQSRLKLMGDGKTGIIEILNYEQGQTFDLIITDALGVNGQTMKPSADGYKQTIITPVPLAVEISPAPGTIRVPNQSDILLTFGEDVVNPDCLADTLKIDPDIPGSVTWLSARQAKFTPNAKWGFETMVKVKLTGGPKGPATLGGSYVNSDLTSTFETMPSKMIELNLSEQKLYCYEEGALVFSCYIATGKAGYRTRTGDFRIYAKDRYVDMQSSPGDPEPYMVTDVPFVNWFSGGQAIHGCYWSSEYGYPRSHGCVNVAVGNAEWVYGWAPVGTPVYVHY
jgi:hypothetical protein